MTADQSALDRLCMLFGITSEYTDIWGECHTASVDIKRKLLTAMGLTLDETTELQQVLENCERYLWQRLLPPVLVLRQTEGNLRIQLNIADNHAQTALTWTLVLESGETHSGRFRPCDLPVLENDKHSGIRRYEYSLPVMPDLGYHRFEVSVEGQSLAVMSLIMAPDRCYQPTILADAERVWGPALQLYALRSQRNWGIGDLSDLKVVLEEAAALGAAIVGVNPLHALFPHDPGNASPYNPSSRLFFNVLYLDVEAIAEFADCAAAQEAVNEPQFQARLRALRASELVDYAAVAEVKFSILERLYRHFRDHHLRTDSPRSRQFSDFQAAEGEALRQQALFEALQEHFHREDSTVWGWPVWPEPYRDPTSLRVAAFASAYAERVEFYEYLQWQVAQQLEALGKRSLELGLGIGFYQDLAVSADRGGAEVWANQALYAANVGIGAPPDDFNVQGQNWGLPPLNPLRFAEVAYRPFIQMLRKNMRHAGALRIDHVMGLLRLFWVPSGMTPTEGTYVTYPFEDLLSIVALESQRNQCLVIGEDLGTVPEGMRKVLASSGVLSHCLFYFEKKPDGDFNSPADYPRQALVAVSTHDLPTLNGYWQGNDLMLRDELKLFPSLEFRDARIIERAQDRARLRVALEREGLLPAGIDVHAISMPEMTPELTRAIHLYLARSPAQILMVQMENVFGQIEQANLPGGTLEQYANWRHKLPLNLEDWPSDPRWQALAEVLRRERGVPERPVRVATPVQALKRVRIPASTYRLQFHGGFTFARATAIVPYLQMLGISHCYASPYLRARSGSTHGYDIIDHHALNSEIGSREDFEVLSESLRHHGIGQILDVVPNHMGVMGSDNAWWLDVLENGPAAVHAPFFDIDWQPFKEELRGKVLLPVLGNHYGLVLENGELQLVLDKEAGAFRVQYYEHSFPIDPREYPRILRHHIEQLEARLGSENPQLLEYQSLVTAFEHLPECRETKPEKQHERNRDKEIHKRHLAELCRNSPDIAWFVEEKLRFFNSTPGEPQSFDALHALLEAQAYLLSFWRVAADDINYRRFFDINDLAGLRMEDETVFRETHSLVGELLAEGKLDGLRIDHPDGLYNPKQYFQRLQRLLVTPAGVQDTAVAEEERSLYVVVEKILESYERLPEDWPVHGTTGYEFANLVTALLIKADAEESLQRTYDEFIGNHIDFEEMLYRCKKLIIELALASELNVLANQLCRIAQADRRTRDFTLNGLRNALEEIVACFPVYRTYITPEHVSEEDKRYIDWAVSVAKKRSQAADDTIFEFVRGVLLTEQAKGKPEAFQELVTAFAMKFQQYTGPLMAKGLEDTAFYQYNRLVSLNEVGGDPRRFAVSVSGYHLVNQERVRQWPYAMLSTSTHDSKRSEDVRARINVLSEFPEEWDRQLKRWSRINRNKKRLVDNELAPSANDEYLLYQILLGACPLETLDAAGYENFRERIANYMLKAVKEAKAHSSWTKPNEEYHRAVVEFVDKLLDSEKNRFLEEFLPFQQRIAHFGLLNSLSQTLLKLTSPGVPDIYQGNEIWDFSLVDPDNRRPVDYSHREALLRDLQGLVNVPDEEVAPRVRDLLDTLEDGRVKLYITWKTLALRRERPELFREGDYLPLPVGGTKGDHVCVFARRYEDQQALVVVPRLYVGLVEGQDREQPLGKSVWKDTFLELPESRNASYVNILTQEIMTPQGGEAVATVMLADVLRYFPVALLVRRS